MTSDEFLKHYSEGNNRRFFMRTVDDVKTGAGYYTTGFYTEVVDRETNCVVGNDCAEPEDKTLLRDFAWVVDALNDLNESKEQVMFSALSTQIFYLERDIDTLEMIQSECALCATYTDIDTMRTDAYRDMVRTQNEIYRKKHLLNQLQNTRTLIGLGIGGI